MPKDKIKTIEDLKTQYPKLCEQLVNQGRQEATEIAQKLAQRGLQRGAENIEQLTIKLYKDLVVALARGFTFDLPEGGDRENLN